MMPPANRHYVSLDLLHNLWSICIARIPLNVLSNLSPKLGDFFYLSPKLRDSAAKLNEKKAISVRTLLKDVYF